MVLLLGTYLVALVLLITVSGAVLQVETILGVSMQVPHGAVIPGLVAIVLGYCLSRRDDCEIGAIRAVLLADFAVVAVLVLVTEVVGLVLQNQWISVLATRNLTGLCGLVFILHGLGRARWAPTVVAAYIMCCLLAGSEARSKMLWSWAIKPPGDEVAAVLAAATAALGAVLAWRRG